MKKIAEYINHKAVVYIVVIIGMILLVWGIEVAVAPYNKITELQKFVNSDTIYTKNFSSANNLPEMVPLVQEKAYKNALLELSRNDSIELVINLSDSTIALVFKGVMLHVVPISEFEKDKLFDKLTLKQEVKLFSTPLAIQSQWATIVKEPIVERQAPKDTLEASVTAWKPDTLIQNPAFAIFSLDHGIQILLEQEEISTAQDRVALHRFNRRIWSQKMKASVNNFVRQKKQDYQPTITIKLPVDDLRSIYRALPDSCYVVLKNA